MCIHFTRQYCVCAGSEGRGPQPDDGRRPTAGEPRKEPLQQHPAMLVLMHHRVCRLIKWLYFSPLQQQITYKKEKEYKNQLKWSQIESLNEMKIDK